MTSRWALPIDVPPATMQAGVEQEYQVWEGARQQDFRPMLEDCARHLVRRDPSDPRARRLEGGLGLTADGWEAELVTPPLPLSPAGLRDTSARLLDGEARLTTELGQARLVGFSTHLNVSAMDRTVVETARAFALTCSSLINALVEPSERTGVLVRPRRGRLEVRCDHLTGAALLAGLAVVAGCVRGLERGARPPSVAAGRVVPSREKFGFFVPPAALGPPDPELVRWVDPHVLSLGLPSAGPGWLGRYSDLLGTSGESTWSDVDPGPRERSGLRLSCAWLTWRHAVWSVHDPVRAVTRYAVVPAAAESALLTKWDAGQLDEVLTQAMRSSRRRILYRHRQITRPAIWTDVRPGALVPAERLADGSVPRVQRSAARRDWSQHGRPPLVAPLDG